MTACLISQAQIAPTEYTLDGWHLRAPPSSGRLFDEMRFAPSVRAAVVAMDMAAAARLISVGLMSAVRRCSVLPGLACSTCAMRCARF